MAESGAMMGEVMSAEDDKRDLLAERAIRMGLPVIRLMHAYMPLSLARWTIEQSAARAQLGEGIRREETFADGVRCEWIIPQGCEGEGAGVLFYIHGGSFVLGLTSLHLAMGATLAQKMSVRVLMVDYRLGPESPFPAALNDCTVAYRWLLRQGVAAKEIVMAGDSAGGNLTLTTLMRLRDSGDPLPAAAACLSPVTNLARRETELAGEYDALLHPRAAQLARRCYVGQHEARDPLVSPAYGAWEGLPPLLIHAGEEEVLRHDAVQAAELAEEAGIDVRLKIYPRMWHVWQLYPSLPQAQQSLAEIAHFLREHLEGHGA